MSSAPVSPLAIGSVPLLLRKAIAVGFGIGHGRLCRHDGGIDWGEGDGRGFGQAAEERSVVASIDIDFEPLLPFASRYYDIEEGREVR